MAAENEALGISQDEVDYFELSMKYHRNRFLMKNEWFVTLITVSYILFVKLVGPRFMKNRRPFNVKYIMFVYNLFQVFANLYILRQIFANNGVQFLYRMSLYGIKREDNSYFLQLVPIVNMIMILKMVDFLDTVFMVFRKRFSQVTFLHLYHHVMVVVVLYILVKIEIGETLLLPAVINLTVHSVMYSYYCLSLSETLSKNYLHKYKIYITRMQLIQFVLICLQMVYFMLSDYPHPPILTWFVISQTITFIFLFGNFYVKTYWKKKNKHP